MTSVIARKCFGHLAIKKGFINEDQLIEALKIQIAKEQKDDDPVLIGEIMKKLGIMTDEQVEEILASCLESKRFKCSNCGMLLQECPNCSEDLTHFEM